MRILFFKAGLISIQFGRYTFHLLMTDPADWIRLGYRPIHIYTNTDVWGYIHLHHFFFLFTLARLDLRCSNPECRNCRKHYDFYMYF